MDQNFFLFKEVGLDFHFFFSPVFVLPQLLVALKTLWNVGVLHTDIKPDNVMLVNSKEQPLRIKLIDFGLAILISKAKPGMLTQPIGYRCL